MYKGTTPTLTFTFTDCDPTLAESIIVTIAKQGVTVLEKATSALTITETSVSFKLSQEETLAFPTGEVQCQINLLYSDGSRVATNIVKVDWSKNLHGEVMT